MDNMITMEQWRVIEEYVEESARREGESGDVVYKMKGVKNNRVRYLIYDNYDRYTSPGLNFMINEGEDVGELIVYSASEQSYAPISFREGLVIAENFFNCVGSEMSEEIVCEYLDDSHESYKLWS